MGSVKMCKKNLTIRGEKWAKKKIDTTCGEAQRQLLVRGTKTTGERHKNNWGGKEKIDKKKEHNTKKTDRSILSSTGIHRHFCRCHADNNTIVVAGFRRARASTSTSTSTISASIGRCVVSISISTAHTGSGFL